MDFILKAVVRVVDFDLSHFALDVALGHLVGFNVQSGPHVDVSRRLLFPATHGGFSAEGEEEAGHTATRAPHHRRGKRLARSRNPPPRQGWPAALELWWLVCPLCSPFLLSENWCVTLHLLKRTLCDWNLNPLICWIMV